MVLCYAAGYAALGAGVMMVSRAGACDDFEHVEHHLIGYWGLAGMLEDWLARAAEMMPEPRRGDLQRYLLFRAFAAGEGWPRRRPPQQHSA